MSRFRLRGAVGSRALIAPLITLTLIELIIFSVGGGGSPEVSLVTALSFGFPIITWAGREVLNAEPDEQRNLSLLAIGGRFRADLAGLTATYLVALVLVAGCAGWGLAHGEPSKDTPPDDAFGAALSVTATAALLSIGVAAAAVAVAVLASRAVTGVGGAPVLVLVAVPVLTFTVGQNHSSMVTALVPRLIPALRMATADELTSSAAAGLCAQMVVWAAVLVGLPWAVRR